MPIALLLLALLLMLLLFERSPLLRHVGRISHHQRRLQRRNCPLRCRGRAEGFDGSADLHKAGARNARPTVARMKVRRGGRRGAGVSLLCCDDALWLPPIPSAASRRVGWGLDMAGANAHHLLLLLLLLLLASSSCGRGLWGTAATTAFWLTVAVEGINASEANTSYRRGRAAPTTRRKTDARASASAAAANAAHRRRLTAAAATSWAASVLLGGHTTR